MAISWARRSTSQTRVKSNKAATQFGSHLIHCLPHNHLAALVDSSTTDSFDGKSFHVLRSLQQFLAILVRKVAPRYCCILGVIAHSARKWFPENCLDVECPRALCRTNVSKNLVALPVPTCILLGNGSRVCCSFCLWCQHALCHKVVPEKLLDSL